jgi:MFS family permease
VSTIDAVNNVARRHPRDVSIAFAVIVGMMVNMPSIVGATFSLFLKPVSEEFGWGRDTMSFAVMMAFTLTTLLYPFVGRLADRWGARPVVLPGMILLGASIMALSLVQGSALRFDVTFFMVAAAGTLASGVVFGRALAGVFDGNRGKALGICLGVGGGVGAAASPILAHWLIENYGWRWGYIGLGAVPIVIGLPVLFFFLRGERNVPRGIEASGTIRHAPFGLTVSQSLRRPSLWLIAAAIFLSCLANNGLLVHLAALLTDRGDSLGFATAMLSTIAIATCVGQFTSGFLLDRFNSPRVGIPFLVCVLSGLVLIDHTSTPLSQSIGVALFGLGIGSEYSLIPYYISRFFGLRSFGQLYGGIYASASIAGGMGPYVMGRVYENTHSYSSALIVLEAGMVLAIVCVACLGNYVYGARGDTGDMAAVLELAG